MESKTILLVDDEPDVLRVLESGLKVLGFTVITAGNGSDAIISALEFLPDLIILDVLMPDIDGGEVARILQQIPKVKEIPIIFLTGMFPRKRGNCESRTIDGNVMLEKPFEMEELFVAINKLLEEKTPVVD